MKRTSKNRGLIAPHTGDESARGMRRPQLGDEQGFLLLMVVVLAALVLIALALAAPKMKARIQRDQEEELRHRGMEYAHAIKLYYRKFNSYPTGINQLMTSNNLKFLRKKFSDPITGLKVWRPVYFGQVGWGGSTNPNCSTSGSSFNGSAGSNSIFGASGGLLGSSSSGGLGNSGFSATGSSGFGSSSSTAGCPPAADTTNSAGPPSPTNPDGTPAANPAQPPLDAQGLPLGFDRNNPPDPAGFLTPLTTAGSTVAGGGFSSNALASSNPNTMVSSGALGVAGGGQIVGVASLSRKESIMSVKGKNHYNDLEFVYDPTQDYGGMAGMTGTGIGNQQQASPFGNNQTSGFGNSSFGNSGFGNTGFGNSGPGNPPTSAPPTQPSTPSQ